MNQGGAVETICHWNGKLKTTGHAGNFPFFFFFWSLCLLLSSSFILFHGAFATFGICCRVNRSIKYSTVASAKLPEAPGIYLRHRLSVILSIKTSSPCKAAQFILEKLFFLKTCR